MAGKTKTPVFEDTIKSLEEIVVRLEKGDVPLKESLELFEEGCKLTKICNQLLDEANQKVVLYSKNTEEEKEF